MTRRTKYDIIYDVLALCITPRKKTEIVYKCNLNFKLIKKYLSKLLKRGLIKEEKEPERIYITTDAGKNYINQMIPTIELVNDIRV